ncbi:MAG: hypothetical protein, partial [Olavius algarvensis Gamma 3 endosymbiont]
VETLVMFIAPMLFNAAFESIFRKDFQKFAKSGICIH